MENEKYYTPEIEEFHVGFEFEEEFNAPNWTKLMKPPKDLYEWVKLRLDTSHSISIITSKIKKRRVRVKYLDQTDIESLGFEVYRDSFFKYKECYKKDNLLLAVGPTNEISIVMETLNMFKEYPEILFIGKLKNKSELKRLLEQLNING
jgi:hypothetical protein